MAGGFTCAGRGIYIALAPSEGFRSALLQWRCEVENHGMLCFRVISPLCLIGAAALFFMPWLDIRCVANSKTEERYSFSGAQLAWGGGTKRVNGETTVNTLGGRGLPIDKSGFGTFLLTAYISGLILCTVWVCPRRPNQDRALRGLVVAIVLTAVLFGTCCYLFNGEPFPHERDELFFTRWYVCSYLANGLAIVFFLIEWQYFKSRCRRLPGMSADALTSSSNNPSA
jgi:hypothetical protein